MGSPTVVEYVGETVSIVCPLAKTNRTRKANIAIYFRSPDALSGSDYSWSIVILLCLYVYRLKWNRSKLLWYSASRKELLLSNFYYRHAWPTLPLLAPRSSPEISYLLRRHSRGLGDCLLVEYRLQWPGPLSTPTGSPFLELHTTQLTPTVATWPGNNNILRRPQRKVVQAYFVYSWCQF